METINITIPDNLNQKEEWLAISKELGKKLLPANKSILDYKGPKAIGPAYAYEVQELQTKIVVTRKPTEKPIVTRECSVCNTIFDQRVGKKLWTNYGGKVRRIHLCSESCRAQVMELAGEGRTALVKKDLCHLGSRGRRKPLS